MRPGSVTHHWDAHQRYFQLDFAVDEGGNVQFTMPTSAGKVPRGYWMLFVVSGAGTPSLATWVRVV